MKKIIHWLVYSSQNRAKISLTLKGILVGLASFASIALSVYGLNIPNETVNQLIEAILGVFQAVTEVVSAVLIVVGIFRKLHKTATGKNDVLNNI